jgi:hypothetical protein
MISRGITGNVDVTSKITRPQKRQTYCALKVINIMAFAIYKISYCYIIMHRGVSQ